MHLLEALEVGSIDELDFTRPLQLGPLELGLEAAAEAARILRGGLFAGEVSVVPWTFTRPVYWAITHKTEGPAEVFGFPKDIDVDLPTAIEIALIRAIAAMTPDHHATILAGGVEVSIGPASAISDFRKLIHIIDRPMIGTSILFDGATEAVICENANRLLMPIVLDCFASSLRTSPLKFRFLELYRMMEARFLAEIKAKLILNFDAEPSAALSESIDALKSELNQIVGLAETQKDAFEACWTVIDQVKNTNRFSAALFRRVAKKGVDGGGKWKTGAALVYQIRCSIVHAGEKDLIFERFPDGEEVVEMLIPCVERAALMLVGVELC
jgi:hypothetical protein